jgi:FkbM family methyltransferase
MTISEKEASAETVLDKDSGLWYRPDLGELFVIKEQTQYKALEFEDKTVMDVGAHIGCFTSLAIKQGAKHVWAYEPTKESFDILSRNLLSRHMWSTLYNTALIGGSEDSVDFYLSKKYPTCHTHMPVRGREKVTVDAMSFWERVDLHKPDVLKIDVEGGEYDFIFQKEIPDFVEQIAIELHLGKKGYRELGIKTAKLFGDWHYHTSFRFSWHITTLILHRNKQGKGIVKERIEELDL